MAKYTNIRAEKNKFYRNLNVDNSIRKAIKFFHKWKKLAINKEKD